MSKTCVKCLYAKDDTEFSKGSVNWCKSCHNYRMKMYRSNPVAKQKTAKYNALYRAGNLVRMQELGIKYRLRPEFKEEYSNRYARYRARLWQEFLHEYGWLCNGLSDGTSCPNSESDPDRLTIAHLGNDGAAHRRRLGKGNTTRVIQDLMKRGWPKNEGIGIQCGSCQLQDLRELLRARKNRGKAA